MVSMVAFGYQMHPPKIRRHLAPSPWVVSTKNVLPFICHVVSHSLSYYLRLVLLPLHQVSVSLVVLAFTLVYLSLGRSHLLLEDVTIGKKSCPGIACGRYPKPHGNSPAQPAIRVSRESSKPEDRMLEMM